MPASLTSLLPHQTGHTKHRHRHKTLHDASPRGRKRKNSCASSPQSQRQYHRIRCCHPEKGCNRQLFPALHILVHAKLKACGVRLEKFNPSIRHGDKDFTVVQEAVRVDLDPVIGQR